ncbi:MAG: general secretion pathway protein GspB [Pseudomonadota bacterium]|nr:general secretion pathway protein GspB [Pseudomonadota bacterium]
MSFILDALRKSDHERQKNAVPNINQIPSAVKRTKTPRWIVYLMGVLAMCALILGWGWMKTLNSINVPATRTESVRATASASPSNSGSIRSLALEARTATDSAQTTFLAGDIQVEPPVSAVRMEPPETLPSSVVYAPSLSELLATGSNLPNLQLELHVFSPNPSERFVFINSSRYGEGDILQEGPQVIAITIDGVILSYAGQNFMLQRD